MLRPYDRRTLARLERHHAIVNVSPAELDLAARIAIARARETARRKEQLRLERRDLESRT
jgi:hypothetical protein